MIFLRNRFACAYVWKRKTLTDKIPRWDEQGRTIFYFRKMRSTVDLNTIYRYGVLPVCSTHLQYRVQAVMWDGFFVHFKMSTDTAVKTTRFNRLFRAKRKGNAKSLVLYRSGPKRSSPGNPSIVQRSVDRATCTIIIFLLIFGSLMPCTTSS